MPKSAFVWTVIAAQFRNYERRAEG